MQQVSTVQLSSVVSYEVRDSIAVLRIDNPPVNASSAEVRSGLMTGIKTVARDAQITAMVIVGTTNFVSGSDLKEFSVDILPLPELPTVISALENLNIPVIAAMSGATLGGGLELALACDYRVALTGTVVGLPETTLGMIPGAGGSQRTLRLLGPAKTIAFVCSGMRIELSVKRPSALVDEVVEDDLLDAALVLASKVKEKRVLMELPVLQDAPGELENAARLAIAKSKGRPQIISAVGAIIAGTELPPRAALAHERAEFTRLRNGYESGALRHQFFARRTVTKANRPPKGLKVSQVAIVGAGTMGMGIARAFASAGIAAVVFDANTDAAQKSLARVHAELDKDEKRGRLSSEKSQAIRDRVRLVSSLQELSGADLYLEAVFEDMEIKKQVLADLESIAQGAVLATNTSYLDVNELATALKNPAKLVGMHFFSPAFLTKVVEIVRADHTEQLALDTVFAATQALGKVGILARVCDGFIGNRIYNAYRRQCELMLEEGALPLQVDRALTDFGFAMGPFAVADMSGLDIAWRMRRSKDATRDSRERYAIVADELCSLERFGQKSGAGWYTYAAGNRKGAVDQSVTELILQASNTQGLRRREFTDEQIVRRVLLSIANESSLVLAEGIAQRPGDIDLMLVLGYGFPAFRGGISYWASNEPAQQLETDIRELAETTGFGFQIGNLELLCD